MRLDRVGRESNGRIEDRDWIDYDLDRWLTEGGGLRKEGLEEDRRHSGRRVSRDGEDD